MAGDDREWTCFTTTLSQFGGTKPYGNNIISNTIEITEKRASYVKRYVWCNEWNNLGKWIEFNFDIRCSMISLLPKMVVHK